MEKNLRKIKKEVNIYMDLLNNNPQNARKFCKDYLENIALLQSILNECFEIDCEIFLKWCNTCVIVFKLPENNMFQKFKKRFHLKIVNHFLNKLSYNLSLYGNLQEKIVFINRRLTQYQYFT